jgi:hypothetical protein
VAGFGVSCAGSLISIATVLDFLTTLTGSVLLVEG